MHPACWIFCLMLIVAGCVLTMPETRYAGKHHYLVGELSAGHARELVAIGDRHIDTVSEVLGLGAPRGDLSVLVFSSRFGMRTYLKRHCPLRHHSRAACFQTPRGFEITLYGRSPNERVLRDLRHELVHYLLASRYRALPPWADEGLAEYFEVYPHSPGWNRENLELLAKRPPQPGELKELTGLSRSHALSPRQYALSWALVHLIMRDHQFSKNALLRYFGLVRYGAGEEEAFVRCFGMTPADFRPHLNEHLVRLADDAR
jgi:hypothetical protein